MKCIYTGTGFSQASVEHVLQNLLKKMSGTMPGNIRWRRWAATCS